MPDGSGRVATSPAVLNATAGLIGYLRDMVRMSSRSVRSVDSYESRVWLGELPEGVATPTEESEVILRLNYEPPSLPPEIPTSLARWLHPSRVSVPDQGDPPLADSDSAEPRQPTIGEQESVDLA